MINRVRILHEARAAFRTGDVAEMNRLVSEVIAALQAASNDIERADIAHSLASFYRDIGAPDTAEIHARAAIEAEKRLDRPALLGNHFMFLAMLLKDTGRLEQAISHVEEALPCYLAAYGPEHQETRYIASVLAAMKRQEVIV